MNVLITGGTSGIGFSTGIMLAEKGNFVYLTTHKKSQITYLEEKVKLMGLSDLIKCFCLDITKEADRKKLYELDIDCLINNAAIGVGGSILDLPISRIKENFEVNVFATIEMIQTYAASLFLTKKRGRVIVVSSLAGIIPLPFMGVYSATKSSLITFMTCLKKELSFIKSELDVCLIEPGIYRTGFNEVMIDNKDFIEEQSNFKDIYPEVDKWQRFLFKRIGKANLDSISSKIVRAAIDKNMKFLYRAPFSQVLGAKLYMLLFK